MRPVPDKLKVAFLHPDLGIGGAERLVVDTALGLQRLGHNVDIYTSHHDPDHCFEETRDGTLNVCYVPPPLPRSIRGKGHILFAHLRQLHLTLYLLFSGRASEYDVYFVDQLSTCVPLLRTLVRKRVVFYGHFPDKLLADGQFVEGTTGRRTGYSMKRIYRMPMDWLEEVTTRQADILLANSNFTARIFMLHFSSIKQSPRVVYPGINTDAYDVPVPQDREEIGDVFSDRPTLVSLNRFEKKKNSALAVEAFAMIRRGLNSQDKERGFDGLRLVIAGGFDPRLQDNIDTLTQLTSLCDELNLTYSVIPPLPSFPIKSFEKKPDVTLVLNFSTTQRTWLLKSPATLALLYTPTNEHFGIIPVEAMISRLPVLACDSGGPMESVIDPDVSKSVGEMRTGWLRPPHRDAWSEALFDILRLPEAERKELGECARRRAIKLFSLDAMAKNVEGALQEAVKMGEADISLSVWFVFIVSLAVIVLALWILS